MSCGHIFSPISLFGILGFNLLLLVKYATFMQLCKTGWVHNVPAGTCLRVFVRTYAQSDYLSADAGCRSNFGGELSALLKIENATVNQFLTTNVFSKHGIPFWIGLTDRDEQGTFRWQNDIPKATYLNWAPGQPSNGRCTYVRPDGRWATDECHKPRLFICEEFAGIVILPEQEYRSVIK
ncbi:C-type lectin [Elysia marginata]|uniref:C-type lectin n=1 Tax=Elysia marginata TaxID=1093978 RepID=A0AAV4G6G4_9GAST|nr:C-type lectin [Elysia marginata]